MRIISFAAALWFAAAAPLAWSQDSGTVRQPVWSEPSGGNGTGSGGQSGGGNSAGSGEQSGGGNSAGSGEQSGGGNSAGSGEQSGRGDVQPEAASGSEADSAGAADSPGTEIDWSTLDGARYSGGDLPEDQSPLTAKVQLLLDRAGISPGVIDGWRGGMTETAIADLERREGLQVDGQMDPEVWNLLSQHDDRPVTQSYTITQEDTETVPPIPADYSEQAEYERLGYQRVTERLAEKFHMDEEFLRQLNPGAAFEAGETITVMAPGEAMQATIPNVRIDKRRQRLYALDDAGKIVSSYPVTIGSEETPSPSGTVEVVSITRDPWYNYDPETFVQGDNYEKLSLPPGPNNPVGLVWIELNKPGYGIHGTPAPDELFVGASHGCVRMTNWDALALADMVEKGTVVEFVE